MPYTDVKQIGCDYMSVVLAVCGNNYVKLLSDGRVVKFTSDTPPIPVNENYNKLKRINDYVVLGFAGDKIICEKITKKAKKDLAVKGINELRLDEVSVVFQKAARSIELEMLKVHFIIGGISNKSKYGLCILNSANDFALEYYFPNYGEHQVKSSFPFGRQDICDALIGKYFNDFPKTLVGLDAAMNNFANEIADLDMTVNKTHYTIAIVKHP